MIQAMQRNWWTIILRGVVAIVFGIVAFVWPLVTALAFVLLLAAFAFVEGVFALVGAFGWGLSGRQRLLLFLLGLLGLAVGVLAVVYPHIAALTIVLWVAWWAIVGGIIAIVVAIEWRKSIEHDWLLVLSGVLSIIFGILLIWRPVAGVLTLIYLFGFYAIIYGIIMLTLGFRVRSVLPRTPSSA